MWTTVSIKNSTKQRIEWWADRLGLPPERFLIAMLDALDSPRYREIVEHYAEIHKVNKRFDEAKTVEERARIAEEMERLAERSREFL